MKYVPINTSGNKNVPSSIRGKKSITLHEFMDNYYFAYVQVRKRSWKIDERLYRRHIFPFFGQKKLYKISRTDVESWFNGLLEAGFKPSSCNRILAVFKTICSVAEKFEIIPLGKSPCMKISTVKTHIQCEHYLSKNEARLLMDELEKSTRLEASIIKLLLLTGARKSEILKAKWEDINFDLHLLLVPLSKSGKSRHIILSDEAIRIIKSLPRTKENPYLFPGIKKNRPLSDIYIYWNELRVLLGLENVRIHDLRHTFASFLVNEGHSLYEVQKILGHSDPRVTMRYAHLERENLIKATETVSSLF